VAFRCLQRNGPRANDETLSSSGLRHSAAGSRNEQKSRVPETVKRMSSGAEKCASFMVHFDA